MSKERQDLIILNLDKISPSAWEEIKKCFTVISDVTNFPDEYFKRLDDLYDEYWNPEPLEHQSTNQDS